MTKKTYLHEILSHYFDTQDLNTEAWTQDENGHYTTNQEEIEWFQRYENALNHIGNKELKSLEVNEYDDIIAYYEGGKK